MYWGLRPLYKWFINNSLWINPSIHGIFEHITHSEYSINIASKRQMEPSEHGRLVNPTLSLVSLGTIRRPNVGTWTHVAVVFDPDAGMFIYMDGILDAFKSVSMRLFHIVVHMLPMTTCLVVNNMDIIVLMEHWTKLKFSTKV